MKKTLFLSMALGFVAFTAFAQEQNAAAPSGQMQSRLTPEERAKRQTDRINSTVQLSADQYAKVLEINKNFGAKKDALRKAGGEGDDLKAKFKALNEQEDVQIKGVLTADQYTKLQSARKEHQAAPKGE